MWWVTYAWEGNIFWESGLLLFQLLFFPPTILRLLEFFLGLTLPLQHFLPRLLSFGQPKLKKRSYLVHFHWRSNFLVVTNRIFLASSDWILLR